MLGALQENSSQEMSFSPAISLFLGCSYFY